MHSDVAIIVPARIGSERLANKPLQAIGSQTMIEHMVKQIKKTKVSNIFVATDSELIAQKAKNCGCEVIMTSASCQSGTDRVYEAFKLLPNNQDIEYIINVQGDMPFINPLVILSVIDSLKNSEYDIITPATKVGIDLAASDSNVKIVVDSNNKALYFSRRLIPYNAKEFLYHIGIYGFRKKALMDFVKLPVSVLEQSERLEQLRALEHGLSIGVCYVDDIPISIDTTQDLAKAVEFYNQTVVS